LQQFLPFNMTTCAETAAMNLVEKSKPALLSGSLWYRVPARKARLFAVACCRAVYRSLADDRSRWAVEVAERYADGRAVDRELWLANDAAEMALDDNPEPTWPEFAASWVADVHAARAAWEIACDSRGWPNPLVWTVKAALLGCLFGEAPLAPLAVTSPILAWRDGTAPRIARAIYQEKSWEDLPILADALEDAGCTNESLLRHCREPGLHARGCHALDAVLQPCATRRQGGNWSATVTVRKNRSPVVTGGTS
jgi:hypothetical protein